MQKLHLLSATLGLLAVASFPAEPADDIKPPTGYRHWFHVNTMIVDKGSPLFADLGGMHNVYVKSVAGRAQEGRAVSQQDHVRNRLTRVHHLRRLLRGRRPQGAGRHGEGLEEICIDRRLGLSALGGRRSEEAAGDRRRQTMLRVSPAEKRPGLRLFHLHSVKRGKGAQRSRNTAWRKLDEVLPTRAEPNGASRACLLTPFTPAFRSASALPGATTCNMDAAPRRCCSTAAAR